MYLTIWECKKVRRQGFLDQLENYGLLHKFKQNIVLLPKGNYFD